MTPQMRAALIRSIIGGTVAASFAAVTWMATQPQYAVAATIFGAFLTRFVAEGGYDSNRQKRGRYHKADVGVKDDAPRGNDLLSGRNEEKL